MQHFINKSASISGKQSMLDGIQSGNAASQLKKMKKDLLISEYDCSIRGLNHSQKWMKEILFCLADVELEESVALESLYDILGIEYPAYSLAISCLSHKEYDRAAHLLRNAKSAICKFVHFYSRYLSGEKKKNEDIVEPLTAVDHHNATYLKELHSELLPYFQSNQDKSMELESTSEDAWLLWLYGVVLKRLDLKNEAVDTLCKSVRAAPNHWGAWLELTYLVTSVEELEKLAVPKDGWMYRLFAAHIYLELHMTEEASAIYTDFEEMGLRDSVYIKTQLALVAHNFKDIDRAISLFKEIEGIDPYRLESVDVYSNLLYVKEMRADLAHLAHRVVSIDKYRVETCCVIGNYYSLRGQHERATQYFQRALRLNPHYLSGWTLMGHEYMEMKNTNAAIQCYRQAIEMKPTDYRAWYGLGQTYEVLKLPAYSIYYYKQAHKLHPNDSRTLIAMGDSYEKLEKWIEAKKCYHKARGIGDIEDIALLRLARLYSQLGDCEKAAAVYERLLRDSDDQSAADERGQAYLFLAEHYHQKDMLDHAYEFAHKCTLYPETREPGKTILNEIAAKRLNEDHKRNENASIFSPGSPLFNLDPDIPSTSRVPHLSFSP